MARGSDYGLHRLDPSPSQRDHPTSKAMSPLLAPIFLAIYAGLLIFLIGVILRRKKWILIGLPAVLLKGCWLVSASIPPNPQLEFDRIFGSGNRSLAHEIDIIKPTFMDGHFISFKIPWKDFSDRIQPQFEWTEFTNCHLLRGQKLPHGWPQSVADSHSALFKELDHQKILIYYDAASGTAYGSVRYDQW